MRAADAPEEENSQIWIIAAACWAVALIAYYFYNKKKQAGDGDNGVDQLTLDDVVGKKHSPEDEEDDSPEFQLLKTLDNSMPKLEKGLSGLLTPRGTLELQKIVTEHVMNCFKAEKEDLMKQRIEAFKDSQWDRYSEMIQKAAQGMMKLQMEMTGKACTHLQYTPQQFQQMMAGLQKDQTMAKEFELFKQQLSAKQDGELPNKTREEVKKVRIH